MPLVTKGHKDVDTLPEQSEPHAPREPTGLHGAVCLAANDPVGLSVLAERLTVERDTAELGRLFDMVVAKGGNEAASCLIPLLRSDDACRRTGAVGALKRMPVELAGIAQDLLADPNPDLRIMTIDALQDIPYPDAVIWLSDRLAVEDHANVVGALVDRLGEIGNPAGLDAIKAVLQRFQDQPYVVFACETAVAAIGRP